MSGAAVRSRILDVAGAAPAVGWFGLSMAQSVHAASTSASFGAGPLTVCVYAADAALLGIMIFLLLARRPPLAKARGAWPRIAAIVGLVAPLAFLFLPRASPDAFRTDISSAVMLAGTLAAIATVPWLGRSFSILPQARALVTKGPYRYVRHPLYLAELVVVAGLVLSLALPWGALMLLVAVAAQIPRMHCEEQVLRRAFSDYAAYARSTRRLVPGLY